ncbi:MAG: ABC transporter ATP-binding protein [Candidatus Onthovivens sp.]|nr:ABC transporter ATP-binding protein [Candidatus Onthovivens sp.]
MSIKINNISFKYDKKTPELTLNDINLNLKEASINVLLGLNGCGKTTLLKLLAGLEKPLSGAIYYDEEELTKISIKERSKRFSYVPQYSYVIGDILVRDYLLFGTANKLAFYQSPGEEEKQLVASVSERLGITHLLDKNIGEVSGGERQIIFIACALIQDTPIILLDEPTSALDIKNQNKVLTVLKEISKESKTIILSSHNPNHALFLDSNVILMNKGVIATTGIAKDLITVEKLTSIYGEHVCYSDELGYREISFK